MKLDKDDMIFKIVDDFINILESIQKGKLPIKVRVASVSANVEVRKLQLELLKIM